MKLIGDSRDGGGDDSVVEGHAEDRETQCDCNQDQLGAAGIFSIRILVVRRSISNSNSISIRFVLGFSYRLRRDVGFGLFV